MNFLRKNVLLFITYQSTGITRLIESKGRCIFKTILRVYNTLIVYKNKTTFFHQNPPF